MAKLYSSLSEWWPLLSPPSEYEEEAAAYRAALLPDGASDAPLTLLELGSGGGNNASHLKRHFLMTLVDLSPGMLAVSQALNPECEHFQGDMRSVRLGRTFDRVFIHDAICYMTTLEDLRRAMETAFVHCRPGGLALFAPDYVRETFSPSEDVGGSDGGDGRGLRYLAWCWDPDPSDSSYLVDYAYLLRERDGSMRVEHDQHEEGLFSRQDWLRLLREVGFDASAASFEHSDVDRPLDLFVGRRPT